MCAAYILGQIDKGNKEAINSLLKLLEPTENEAIRWQAVYASRQIGQENQNLFNFFLNSFEKAENIDDDKGTLDAMDSLFKPSEKPENEAIRVYAVYALGQIGQGNKEAINSLLNLLEPTENEAIRVQAVYALRQIGQGNKEAINSLFKLLEPTENEAIRVQAVYALGQIGQGNKEAINSLFKLLEPTENETIRVQEAAVALGRILTVNGMSFVVAGLQQYSESNSHVYELIWNCAQVLPYPEFYQAWNNA